jgi:hypothetical protein
MVWSGFRFRASEGVVHPDSTPCRRTSERRTLRQIIFRSTSEKSRKIKDPAQPDQDV